MKQKRKAFTLVELLVSMAVLTVIVVLTAQILTHVMKIWTAGSQRAELYQSARAAIEMMGRELSIAEALPAQMQGNFKSYASSPLVINPPLPATLSLLKDSDGKPMDSLFFYAPLQPSPLGPLVSIGYIVNDDHSLQRLAVPADTTEYSMAAANLPTANMWSTGDSGTPPNRIMGRTNKLSQFVEPVSWLNLTSASWLASPPTKTVADALSNGNVSSIVADRVVGFVVRPIGQDGAPLPSTLLPATAPSSTVGTPLSRAYNSAWWPVADALPSQIEITLVLCEANAYRRLNAENKLPLLTMPTDNSDAKLKEALTDLKTRLQGKVDQYIILTRRFPLIRGSR